MPKLVEVSALRLNVMRAGYLVLFGGLASSEWPGLIHPEGWTSSHGVASSLLAAMSVLAVLGLRHPLQMAPLLFFELVWKAIWLVAIGLPRWLAHDVDAYTQRQTIVCLAAMVIVPLLIPWPYVVATYVTKPADRWR
ncbi:hypothetical protein [Phenylobacterium sp.]|jgi:hypothetical protein|uniref:hypothetical protein n=1 Tax=Phenylobacterium sp. TaxID=1871053 RepID=UPI002F3F4D17